MSPGGLRLTRRTTYTGASTNSTITMTPIAWTIVPIFGTGTFFKATLGTCCSPDEQPVKDSAKREDGEGDHEEDCGASVPIEVREGRFVTPPRHHGRLGSGAAVRQNEQQHEHAEAGDRGDHANQEGRFAHPGQRHVKEPADRAGAV